MGRQRVQDGSLRFRGFALRALAGPQLFLGVAKEVWFAVSACHGVQRAATQRLQLLLAHTAMHDSYETVTSKLCMLQSPLGHSFRHSV
jgi:hypothetical protein